MNANAEGGCSNAEMTREHPFLDGFRVIHLHPTLRCNLACKHCYSSSAPGLKKELHPKEITAFLKYAREYGFNALSVSGGEPFLYSGLEQVLTESKKLGYKNIVASNGMLLKTQRARGILESIDLIAISIDGDEQLHDEMRNQKGAYAKMLEGVAVLKKLKKEFGFIHTLTPRSWDVLLELFRFANDQGAKLLQVHPLELYGRAATEMADAVTDQEFLHKVYILGNYLKSKYYPEMLVQLDFLHRENILEHPETASYFGAGFSADCDTFSKALKTIVIDEHGNVVPISYGFSNRFLIGNIGDSWHRTNMFERYLAHTWGLLYQLLERTYYEIVADEENDLVVWTELIVKNSHLYQLQSSFADS
ncbi:MAG TPA: radical SAM protein [Pricia sp.]|nr:radical SAM protein [Pricia sp.]